MAKETLEAKFNRLRDKYLEKQTAFDTFKWELDRKYGPGRSGAWMKRTEEQREARLRDAATKAGKFLFDYIQSISPRDWSYGVPAYWVNEKLSFADAVRPIDEPLSVVPPLSHGATSPRT